MHRRSILAAALSAGAVSACGSGDDLGGAPSASAPQLGPPVARPAEVRGTAVLGPVQRVHELLREVYDLSLILPGLRWEASAVVLAGLPITATETVDERGPLRLALVEEAARTISVAIAIPLRAPDKLIATVTAGEGAGHRVKRDDAAQLDWLHPVRPDEHAGIVLGVARNHLIVGTSARAVSLSGAFLAHPAPTELAIGQGDLSAQLSAVAASFLVQKLAPLLLRVGPDLSVLGDLFAQGDAAAALALAEQVNLTLKLTRESLQLEATVVRTGGSPAPVCEEGPRSELLEANADATVAFGVYASEEDRRASASKAARWIRGARLIEQSREAEIASALGELASARGSALRLSLEKSPRGWLAYGSSQVRDGGALDAALDTLQKAFTGGDPEAGGAALTIAMESTVLERIGDVRRLRIRKRGEDAKPSQTLATVFLRHSCAPGAARDCGSSGRLALATGADAAYALRKALGLPAEGEPVSALEGLASVRALIGGIDERASAYFFIDPAALLALPRPGRDRARGAWLGSLKSCGATWSLRSALDPQAVIALLGALTASGTSSAPRAD